MEQVFFSKEFRNQGRSMQGININPKFLNSLEKKEQTLVP